MRHGGEQIACRSVRHPLDLQNHGSLAVGGDKALIIFGEWLMVGAFHPGCEVTNATNVSRSDTQDFDITLPSTIFLQIFPLELWATWTVIGNQR